MTTIYLEVLASWKLPSFVKHCYNTFSPLTARAYVLTQWYMENSKIEGRYVFVVYISDSSTFHHIAGVQNTPIQRQIDIYILAY